MNAFQKVKCQERDNVFGKKDIATKLNGFKAPNHTHSSSVEAGLNLQTQTSEKPKNFVRLGNLLKSHYNFIYLFKFRKRGRSFEFI